MGPRVRHAVLLAAVSLLVAARPAHAEALPPGSIGGFIGGVAGTGADATTLGAGYVLGAAAAWQPMTTEQRVGWSLKWAIAFATMYGAEAARIESELATQQMDLQVGIRLRPGASPRRYLTLRAGGALFRTNQVIPDRDDPTRSQRAFAGGIASIGIDQHFSFWLLSVDLRYSLVGGGPGGLALVIGGSLTGP